VLTLAFVRFVFSGVLLASAAVSAQPLAVSVMDAQGVGEATVRKVHRAAVEQLKGLTPASVSDTYDWKGPKRSCAQDDLKCLYDRMKGAGVALWLSGGKDRDRVVATAAFFDGELVSKLRSADLSADAPDVAALLDAAVPAWMKKGWGAVGLTTAPPSGSVIKLDGRVVPSKRGELIAVTAGPHQVDVVYPDGRAVLQRIDVAEGSRTRVDVAPAPAAASMSEKAAGGFSALRFASYAAWMAGTATLLAAFIVGFVGRQTANGQSPCRPDTRDCVTLGEAMEQQRRAAGYASTANVLLGTGLVFAVAGAGLFTFDVLR